jgi:UDP-2,3-diacylglucosamine pyrophosphatase LpxH
MDRNTTFGHQVLQRLFERTDEIPLSESDRIVIFSDLHMGNGGPTDDFQGNGSMFHEVLRKRYLASGHTLVLNGDIEELQRFRLPDIRRRWESVYHIFDSFAGDGRLHRLIGNHDMDLLLMRDRPFSLEHALRFSYHGNPIFLFHGHQTSRVFQNYNHLVGLSLRLFANPFRIGNVSVAHDSRKRFRTEEKIYQFASSNKLLAIVGHTHRPLFESMSKVDTLRFEIERLCRKYPKASAKKQRRIEQVIALHKAELARIRFQEKEQDQSSLYNANLLIPCIFNSGTVIGKRGMTCLEIDAGRIALVHWFDERIARKYLRYRNIEVDGLPGTSYHRAVIKQENLDYIFARIKLLAG